MFCVKVRCQNRVVKPLNASLWPTRLPATLREKIKDGADLLVTLAALVLNFLRLSRCIADFRRRLDSALAPTHPPLEDLRPDELLDQIHARVEFLEAESEVTA